MNNPIAPISDEPQPDAIPAGAPPSLWLYTALLGIAVGLVIIAFAMQTRADWPGLLLNLAAGLFGSVVILVFVDRRLRAQELTALRNLPARTTRGFSWLLFPTSRIGLRYARRLLIALEPLVVGKVHLEQFATLEAEARKGFVLIGAAGQGKTTWTQIVAASLARQYLNGLAEGRLPIIVPLARWLPDRTIDDALYENFSSYVPCRRWLFDRLFRSAQIVVLLDGYEELWNRYLPFEAEIDRLRRQFPTVVWTITARTDMPSPEGFGNVIRLSAPTADEMAVIRHSLMKYRAYRGGG